MLRMKENYYYNGINHSCIISEKISKIVNIVTMVNIAIHAKKIAI